ncbi:IS110 family transposase [Rhizobium lentis]|uniref:IS110 family transposase n=1 Tax=Rhizobium lentis TaxID=1138194 RepID=UPI001C833161|nr:IS110 family transposase [Rhizobium lentis]MBX5087327.1 IS110 family transposase [Rhizobium lentis]MBX5100051.1 IS110 family transposase [Rhizobium lentis]MBX5124747.1 IS110 family transposase [Rhizobium lentis]
MQYFAGLDISVKETSVCIVDAEGRIVRETKVPSHPEDLLRVLSESGHQYRRIGLEAGPLSQWLYSALAEANLPVFCIEARHTRAFLAAQINKTDRNDARGIAQMMRVNIFRPVHVKTITSQKQRALLRARKMLQSKSKAMDIENDLRGILRNFGLKVGIVSTLNFEQRIRELIDDDEELLAIVGPLLAARREIRSQFNILHRRLLAIAKNDGICRRLMTVPGVGAVVALAYRSAIDVPARFQNSKAVGAFVGLTPASHQSGEKSRVGKVSCSGDTMVRTLLYEAAVTLLTRGQKWSWLRAWGMRIAKSRGVNKAFVAIARRLAVIMHRMWQDQTDFRWTKEERITTI